MARAAAPAASAPFTHGLGLRTAGRCCSDIPSMSRLAEHHDPEPVIGGQDHVGEKAGHDAAVADQAVPALLAELEPQPPARRPGIELEVRLEHGGQGVGLEHRAVLAAAATQQGGHVAGHVRGGGVQAAPAGGHDLAVSHRLEATRAQHVPGGQARPDPLGADQVGVPHPQWVKDVLA